MRIVHFLLTALVWMSVTSTTRSSWAAPKPEFTIKQVMKESIKGHSALVKKACKGTATPEEMDRMIRYFRAMAECSPPQGDMDSWKAKSGALLQAALAVQKSPQDKSAALALENAVECRQCHNPHKPSQN
jgi:hypothetical protein